jgi:hypothetical protein
MGEQRFNNFQSFGGGLSHPQAALPIQAVAAEATLAEAAMSVAAVICKLTQ